MVRKPVITIVLLVLLVDQLVKIYVKTHMYLGQEINVLGDWFIIHFTENPGMAFGLVLEGKYGKLFLSLFRIIAVIGIAYYLHVIKPKAHKGFMYSMALILAGAIGNILDSAFYGLIFSESDFEPATMFPEEGGYAPFLHGRVVDMFYFPIVEGHFPSWFPFWANEQFIFFRPVFNVADAAITTGFLLIFIFQKRFFSKLDDEKENKERTDLPTQENQDTTQFTPNESVNSDSTKL